MGYYPPPSSQNFYNKFNSNFGDKTTNSNYNITPSDKLMSNQFGPNFDNYSFYYSQPGVNNIFKKERQDPLLSYNHSNIFNHATHQNNIIGHNNYRSNRNDKFGQISVSEANKGNNDQSKQDYAKNIQNVTQKNGNGREKYGKAPQNAIFTERGSFKKNMPNQGYLNLKNDNNQNNSSKKVNYFKNSSKKNNGFNNNSQQTSSKKLNQKLQNSSNLKKPSKNNVCNQKQSKGFSLANQQISNDNVMLQINIKLKNIEKSIRLKKHEDVLVCAKSFCFNNHLSESLIKPIRDRILSAIQHVDKTFNTSLTSTSASHLKEIEAIYSTETKDSSLSLDSIADYSESEGEELNISSISEFCVQEESEEEEILNRSF